MLSESSPGVVLGGGIGLLAGEFVAAVAAEAVERCARDSLADEALVESLRPVAS